MKKITALWNQFFFEPISPATIGLYRIFYGLVVLDSLVGKFLDRDMLYSDKALVTSNTVSMYYKGVSPIFQFYQLLPQNDPQLKWFFFGLMAITGCFILGIFTRAINVILFIGLMILDNRNFFAVNAGDEIIRICCFFLIFSAAGSAYSLDRWIRMKRKLEGENLPLKSPWGQRLLQLQFAYIYLDSVFLKLPGASWRDGTAMYYALNYLELRRFEFKWLFYSLWQIKLATWGGMIVEILMGTLVWFRKWRYWCLLLALLFHGCINLVMQFPIFQYAMMVCLILFVFPEDIETFFGRLKMRLKRP